MKTTFWGGGGGGGGQGEFCGLSNFSSRNIKDLIIVSYGAKIGTGLINAW